MLDGLVSTHYIYVVFVTVSILLARPNTTKLVKGHFPSSTVAYLKMRTPMGLFNKKNTDCRFRSRLISVPNNANVCTIT